MKRVFKSNIKLIVGMMLGIVMCSGIVYASGILASQITYNNTTVEAALDDLYSKAGSQKLCRLVSGTKETVGAKYECYLGDWQIRNFYVLKVEGNNVKLIMEKNISDEISNSPVSMTYASAMEYFNEGHPGYSTKQTWLNRAQSVDLPDAQDIANAGGITGWDVTSTTTTWSYFGVNSTTDPGNSVKSNYSWLYNYTRACSEWGSCSSGYGANDSNHAYGYWTKSVVASNNSSYWCVSSSGALYSSDDNDSDRGIRPVITVSKSKLAG